MDKKKELQPHEVWLPGTPLKLQFTLGNFAMAQKRDGIRVSIKNLAEPSLGDFTDLVAVGAAHYNLPLSEVMAHVENVKGNRFTVLMNMVDAISIALGMGEETGGDDPDDGNPGGDENLGEA